MSHRRSGMPFALAVLIMLQTPLDARSLAIVQAPLVDQFGTTHDFSRGAIGDRVVIVGFTWADCTTVCPITDQIMRQTHEQLAREGKNLRLITLSLAPGKDGPAVMRTRAQKLRAGKNWLWLSGRFVDVNRVLQGLNAVYGPDLASHPPRFLVIDGKRKIIQVIPGLPNSTALIRAAQRLAVARE